MLEICLKFFLLHLDSDPNEACCKTDPVSALVWMPIRITELCANGTKIYIYIYFLILIRHTIIKTKSGDLLFVWNSAKTVFRFCAYLLLVSRFIHKIIIRQGIVFYSFCFLLNLFLQGAGEPFTPSGQLGRRKQIFILQVITNFVRILF